MNDLIHRNEAIRALQEDAEWLAYQGSDWQTERMERDIRILLELPCCEPEILRCRDCKWFIEDDIGCTYMYGLENPTENDFCSRAER